MLLAFPAEAQTNARDGVREIPIGTESRETFPAPAAPSQTQMPTTKDFQLASWNLLAGVRQGDGTVKRFTVRQPAKQTWRHTFGAERETLRFAKQGPAGFQADLVALQGVTSVRDVRRLYPARKYHVILSRQLLATSNSEARGLIAYRQTGAPTTALVYRRQRGVRFAGMRHFVPKRGPGDSEIDDPAAITAIRLRVYRRAFWLASLDVAAGCDAADKQTHQCVERETIVESFLDWAVKSVTPSTPMVLMGHWPSDVSEAIKSRLDNIEHLGAATPSCDPAPTGFMVLHRAGEQSRERVFEVRGPAVSSANACAITSQARLSLQVPQQL